MRNYLDAELRKGRSCDDVSQDFFGESKLSQTTIETMGYKSKRCIEMREYVTSKLFSTMSEKGIVEASFCALEARYRLANQLAKIPGIIRDEKNYMYTLKRHTFQVMRYIAHELKHDKDFQESEWQKNLHLSIENDGEGKGDNLKIGLTVEIDDIIYDNSIIAPHFGYNAHSSIIGSVFENPCVEGGNYPFGWERVRSLRNYGWDMDKIYKELYRNSEITHNESKVS